MKLYCTRRARFSKLKSHVAEIVTRDAIDLVLGKLVCLYP